jgi:hypothetical protein
MAGAAIRDITHILLSLNISPAHALMAGVYLKAHISHEITGSGFAPAILTDIIAAGPFLRYHAVWQAHFL